MWKILLSFIPWEKVIPWFVSKLTGYSETFAEKLLNTTLNYVKEAEEKYGSGNGQRKFEEVKKRIMKTYKEVAGWVANLVIEIAVGIAKRKGLIK